MIKKNKEKAYSVAAIVIIIDQIIKFVISNKMSLEQEIEVIPKFFSLYRKRKRFKQIIYYFFRIYYWRNYW